MATYQDFLPDDDEQLFICGQSGSGKTTFERELIDLLKKEELVIIIDSKPDWDNLAPMIGPNKQNRPRKLDPKLLWMLNKAEAKGVYVYQTIDTIPAYDDPWVTRIILWAIRRFKKLKKRKGLTIVVDEMGDFAKGSYTTPAMSKLMRQGRSKRIRRIIGSQRPAGIPQLSVDQSQRFCIFMLMNRNDRKRMAEWVHPHLEKTAEGHNFWYYEIPRGRPQKPLTYIHQEKKT